MVNEPKNNRYKGTCPHLLQREQVDQTKYV
jgi:hypothetical protein